MDTLHDADDKVVVLPRKRRRSRVAGLPIEMSPAQVWPLRGDRQSRMDARG